jgi:hypothetical protein
LREWLIAERRLAREAAHGALDVAMDGVMPPFTPSSSVLWRGMSVSRFRFNLRLCFFMVGSSSWRTNYLHQREFSDWLIAERRLATEAAQGALDVAMDGVMPPLIADISSFCSGMRVSRLRFSLRLCFFMVGLLSCRGWLAGTDA